MKPTKRKIDLLLPEKKREALNKSLIAFFADERDEEIGYIAAEELIDFFLEEAGAAIRNKTLEEAKKVLKQRFDDLEVDLDLLQEK